MQPVRMESEAETLLVEAQIDLEQEDRRSPVKARVAAVALIVAGCLAVAHLSASQPARKRGALGNPVQLMDVGSSDTSKAHPHKAVETKTQPGIVVRALTPGKETLSDDDCTQLRTLYASAKEGKKQAVEELKKQGLELTDLDQGSDPCQVVPALAKEKQIEDQAEEAEEAEAESGSKVNTSTTTTQPTTHKTTTHMPTNASEKCSGEGADCRSSKCCSKPGTLCYEKSHDWAQCKVDCVPGKDPSDVDSTPWTCKELGKRTAGEPEKCSEVGANCLTSKCCTEVGFACYAKNATYGTCKAGGCTPGPDYSHEDHGAWTCEQLSEPVPGKGPWVDEECANDEDDCREAACCQTSGHQCYEMGEGWAQCKGDCSTDPPAEEWMETWTCNEIGQRTPASAWDASRGPRGGQVASWVRDYCSKDDDDCTSTQCCTEVGAVCYTKDASYAKCMTACDTKAGDTKGWACEEKGTRSFGVARKTWPSLFCFSVIRLCDDETKCYEHKLMQRIHELGPESAGIFGCDDWSVLSNEKAEVGGRDTVLIPGNISVGISKDGTAANTLLFMKVWDIIIKDGRFKTHDWTVKMDPDAVLLPWKLGDHLAPHTNNGEHEGRLFVVNCNAWPGSESFPMMYGSVEIFSKGAMMAYAEHVGHCADKLPWEDWGEDFFITRCMDQIDVGRLEMFNIVGDNLCVGPGQGGTGDCSEGDRAAFHPFKDIEVWTNCYNNAVGFHPDTDAPTPAPQEDNADDQQNWDGQDGGDQNWDNQEGQRRKLRKL